MSKQATPFIAFIPIGLGMVALGITNNRAFLGAGILFIIAGIVGIIRTRDSGKREK